MSATWLMTSALLESDDTSRTTLGVSIVPYSDWNVVVQTRLFECKILYTLLADWLVSWPRIAALIFCTSCPVQCSWSRLRPTYTCRVLLREPRLNYHAQNTEIHVCRVQMCFPQHRWIQQTYKVVPGQHFVGCGGGEWVMVRAQVLSTIQYAYLQ